MKKINLFSFLTIAVLISSCSKDSTVETPNKAPVNGNVSAVVSDIDGDGNADDVTLEFPATDDNAVVSKTLIVKDKAGIISDKVINLPPSHAAAELINLSNAQYSVEFISKDAEGLSDSDSKSFVINVP